MHALYLDSGDLSATKQFKGWKVAQLSRLGFQIFWSNTGAPVGAFSFVVSDHPQACLADGTANPDPAVKWTVLASVPASWAAQQPGAATTPTSGEFGLADFGHLWIAPLYTKSSGGTSSSTVTIRANGKQ